MADIFDLYRNLFGQSEPQQGPPQTYDVGSDTIPLSLDRTPVNDPYTGTAWHQLMGKLGDIGTAVPGLVERAQLGGMNALGMRQENGDIYRSKLPVAPGLTALGDAAAFATGGLASGLAPAAGIYSQAARYGARAAMPVARDLLADTSGGSRLTPAMRRRQAITLDTALPQLADMPALAPLGHNRTMFEPAPQFPQYAEEYPPTGPPQTKINEKGKEYLAKKLTPEAETFAAARSKIQEDMNARGYEPYYDPALRSYVDPSQYPPANVDTFSIVPKTKKSIEEYNAAITDAPEPRLALGGAFERGNQLGNADHWYAMQQLEKSYIDELGPQAGRAAFLDEFAAPMSATTSGNNPTANFLMAHNMEYLRKRGGDMPTEGYELPYPVGGRRGGVNLRDYANMRAGGGYAGLGLGQPKMHDFTRSMIGDLSHPVIDEQMAGGMLAHMPSAFANKARSGPGYGLLARTVADEAAARGIQPGNVQDVAWAGFKDEPGRPMISIINDSIERTHRLTGMPREEIVRRGLVRKEIPMYGLGAGAAALGLGGAYGGSDDEWR